MNDTLEIFPGMVERQNKSLDSIINQERNKLFSFIKKQVASSEDAEDILQDVFYQMTSSYREAKEIEKLSAWLFTVAKNKIIDWYRKRKTTPISSASAMANNEEEEPLTLAEVLPDLSAIDGPEAALMRNMIWEELEAALELLPEAQREVFVMHEFDELSFKEIAEITGEGVNTLLSRKRYAILFIRKQLQEIYDDIFNN